MENLNLTIKVIVVISRKKFLTFFVIIILFFSNLGYVAINAKGRWRMICARKWNDRLSKKICQYLGYRPDNKEPYKQIGTSKYQHLLSSHMKTKGYNHFIAKRQTTNQCTFIENSCSNIKECGTLPLYSSLGPETPIFGEGT